MAEWIKELLSISRNKVTVFEVRFLDEAAVPEYSGSRFCFDGDTDLLIAVDNCGWSEDGKPRLIEHDHYDQIEILPELTEDVFDEANPEY